MEGNLEVQELSKDRSHIDVERLRADLHLDEEAMKALSALDIPDTIVVPSTSPIKTETVAAAMAIAYPERNFTVTGVKVPSGVNEQPLGEDAVRGAENRRKNAEVAAKEMFQGKSFAVVAVENGLFKAAASEGEEANLV